MVPNRPTSLGLVAVHKIVVRIRADPVVVLRLNQVKGVVKVVCALADSAFHHIITGRRRIMIVHSAISERMHDLMDDGRGGEICAAGGV